TKFTIRYYYQENMGKHIATNKGLTESKGEFFTVLDSDDWFYPYTVEFIINKFESNSKIKGIAALDTFEDGSIVGDKFPNLEKGNLIDLLITCKIKGDKFYAFKTKEIIEFKYPQFGKSKHMPPSYILYNYSRNNDIYLFNKALKYVEYQDEGISSNVKINLFTSAENFSYYRNNKFDIMPTFQQKLKHLILFNISWIHLKCAKKHSFQGKMRYISILLLPLSYPLYLYYIRKTHYKNRSMKR